MDYKKEYQSWISSDCFDEQTKKELLSLKDEKEIEDRFYKQLSFGTGGLRGVIGAGTNRMNIYTVGKASQGLAEFVKSQDQNGSVVIAYDSRNMSPEFALRSALIFCANGLKAYLFESLRPTPELSFAVRYLNATAGVVITASHNPPEYNGYKVYWSDGGQIVPPYDKLIIDKVNAVKDYESIKCMEKDKALSLGLLNIIGKEIDDAFTKSIIDLVLNPEIIKEQANNLKIVYTPLHGAGNMPVRRILNELGFEKVWVVPEQEEPDGNFTTLEYPNPEDPKAFTYALNLAKEVKADIVLATDPDADRLGIYALDTKSGEYKSFTGNMSGLLICEYILSQKQEKGLLPKNREDGAIVTTVVSSKMAFDIGKAYGLTVKEVLTGFKYIGEQIKLFEDAKKENQGKLSAKCGAFEYLFGYEESYGSLIGTHARDKDAVSAVVALCEAAAYYKSKGLTLCDQMQKIYQKYGFYKEDLYTVTIKGASGAEKIKAIIDGLRKNTPKNIGEFKVLSLSDFDSGIKTDMNTGDKQDITLPKSNVLYFELENSCWCCVRPSGTEPKIKFYFGVKENSEEKALIKLERLKEELLKISE